ncbi:MULTISPECIES: transposase [unclassified Acinetobacter]|nr:MULTISPECIES: transposase [unclassified Acinetobacter]
MSGQRYTPEFKGEAVKLITKCGYSITHVTEHLGVHTPNTVFINS